VIIWISWLAWMAAVLVCIIFAWGGRQTVIIAFFKALKRVFFINVNVLSISELMSDT